VRICVNCTFVARFSPARRKMVNIVNLTLFKF